MNPDIDPGALGDALAAAGTGPEGMRQLSGMLGFNKSIVKRIEEEAKKGTVARGASQIGKHGKVTAGKLIKIPGRAERGDILEKLLAMNDMSEESLAAQQKSTGFALRSAKAQGLDKLGEKGAALLNSVGSGGNAANWLANKVPGAIDFATNPWVLGGLAGAGGIYGGLSLLGHRMNKIPGAELLSEGGGAGGEGAGLGSRAGGAVPVYVTNWTASTPGTGAGGGFLGTLGKVIPGIALLAGAAEDDSQRATELIGKMNLSGTRKQAVEEFHSGFTGAAGFLKQMGLNVPGLGMSETSILEKFVPPIELNLTVQSIVDGQKVSETVEKRQIKRAKNATANGAAR